MAIEVPSISCHFKGTTPLKVQVTLEIPLFEGKIDANALEKWLNLLENYYSIKKISSGKKIVFTLLKSLPQVKDW
jgi:hypothetical protein